VGEISVGEISVGEISVDEISVGEISFGQYGSTVILLSPRRCREVLLLDC
jgi:hypothetical protein